MCSLGLNWISKCQTMSNHIRQGQPKTYNGQVNIFVFKAEMYGCSGKAQYEE